ncbi:hypothetical protein SFUMM280S_04036 [Streptomyces fumanus]
MEACRGPRVWVIRASADASRCHGAGGVWLWSPREYAVLTPALAACPNDVAALTVPDATPVPAPATCSSTYARDVADRSVSGVESASTRSPVIASPATSTLRGSPPGDV